MDKEKVCEVKKIVLKIEDKEISLSIDQAKKLKGLLNDLFGKEIIKEVITEHHHHRDYYPIWRYEQPIINYPQVTYYQATGAINCSL